MIWTYPFRDDKVEFLNLEVITSFTAVCLKSPLRSSSGQRNSQQIWCEQMYCCSVQWRIGAQDLLMVIQIHAASTNANKWFLLTADRQKPSRLQNWAKALRALSNTDHVCHPLVTLWTAFENKDWWMNIIIGSIIHFKGYNYALSSFI